MSVQVSALAAAGRAVAEGSTFRAVRHALLRLPGREVEFATRTALEDALRTADFNDAGRLIVVRSLTLKGLPCGATGPQIARALERAWEAIASSAVAFIAPGAGRANVVYFRSIHAARLAWLERFAQDGAPAEWFWPRAVPELAGAPAQSALVPLLSALQVNAPQALAETLLGLPPLAIRRVLTALPVARVEELMVAVQAPAGAVAAAALTDAAHAGRRGPALQEAVARTPLATASVRPSPAPRAIPAALAQISRLRARLAAAASGLAPSDWRVSWCAALLLRADSHQVPGATAMAHLVEAALEIAPVMAPAASELPEHTRPAATWSPGTPGTVRASDSAAATVSSQIVSYVECGLPTLQRASVGGAPAARYPWLDDNQATAHGGLLMLLNALEMLGLPAWLADQAPVVRCHFARALLARVARRLRMPADDPQQPLLAIDEAGHRGLQEALCQWHGFRWPRGFDGAGFLPDAAVTGVNDALGRWQRALIRVLRRHAGVGLAHVVFRPAGVSITPTHVDIVLPLAAADAAVRRAGLDRDPGWSPWFGWIVAFHYIGSEGRRDGA